MTFDVEKLTKREVVGMVLKRVWLQCTRVCDLIDGEWYVNVALDAMSGSD